MSTFSDLDIERHNTAEHIRAALDALDVVRVDLMYMDRRPETETIRDALISALHTLGTCRWTKEITI